MSFLFKNLSLLDPNWKEARGGYEVLVEGDTRLFNQYGVIAVNPQRHSGLNAEGAIAFVNWIVSPEGQKAIAEFKVNGVQMFFPTAK